MRDEWKYPKSPRTRTCHAIKTLINDNHLTNHLTPSRRPIAAPPLLGATMPATPPSDRHTTSILISPEYYDRGLKTESPRCISLITS